MSDRDDRGRFLVGCKGGPGRPARTHELAHLRATLATVTPEDWAQVIQKALEQAKEGDARARSFLAKYLLPKEWQEAISDSYITIIVHDDDTPEQDDDN